MKKIIYLLLVSCITACADAQIKRYDILSFTPPVTFKLKEEKQRIVYEKKEGKSFCQLHIWPAQQGSSFDPQANFKTDWDYFAGNQYKIGDPKEKQIEKQNGWDVVTGVGLAEVDGIKFIVSVSTFTQNDISWCAITQFNDEKYAFVIDTFLASIKADATKMVRKNNETNGNRVSNTVTQTASSSGITISTTNFDDGWTSTITNDYVQVIKNGTEVRLYFFDKKVDEQRPPNTGTFEPYYWDAVVKLAYNTGELFIRQKEQYSYGKQDIWEAAVANKQTGKAGYLGMRLVFNNGGCRPIVVIAPDKNTYYSLFGNDEDFMKMFYYNKFAVAQKDLIGKWKSFDAASMSYYSIYSGDYAGMSTASTNDEFIFNNNGTYQSEHHFQWQSVAWQICLQGKIQRQ
jgi:hypothetical protein